jgi:hypothetical protein
MFNYKKVSWIKKKMLLIFDVMSLFIIIFSPAHPPFMHLEYNAICSTVKPQNAKSEVRFKQLIDL